MPDPLFHNTEYKHVKIRVHKKLLPKFIASIPKGFDVTIYPVPGHRKEFDQDVRNMTFQVTRRNPNPLFRKRGEDIDRFLNNLSIIDPRIKILTEKITTKDQPNLMDRPYMKIETLLDQPGLAEDLEMDKYLSTAENITEVKIKQSEVDALEKYYEKHKGEYIRTKFKKGDLRDDGEKDPETNEKIYKVRQAEI
jgi:hypothetical protein